MSSAPASSRPARRRFRPGLPLTVLSLLVLAALLSLGTWQASRLQWKLDLIERAERGLELPPVALPEDEAGMKAHDYRRVTVTGELLGDRSVALGTRGVGGKVGSILLTPLRLPDGRILMVERGWLPAALLPPDEPAVLREQRAADVEGVLRWQGEARQAPFTPDNVPAERRWFWFDRAALEDWLEAPVLPATLAVEDTSGEGGLVPQPVAVAYRNDHLGYAITWYSLAAALVVFYVLLGLKRGES